MMNGGAVSWKSTKQKGVSLTTDEAEWYEASEAGKEIVYLRLAPIPYPRILLHPCRQYHRISLL
jgi:hypothetical protein